MDCQLVASLVRLIRLLRSLFLISQKTELHALNDLVLMYTTRYGRTKKMPPHKRSGNIFNLFQYLVVLLK
jgi:hypothetical protein